VPSALRQRLAGVALAGALAAGCAVPVTTGPPLGVVESLEAEAPGFAFEALPVAEGEGVAVELRVQFAPADLVYTQRDTGYVAAVEIPLAVLDARGRGTLAETVLRDTLFAEDFAETRSPRPLGRSARLAVQPGAHVAQASLVSGGPEPRVTLRVSVEVPEGEVPALTPLRLSREGPAVGMTHPAWEGEGGLEVETDALGAPAEATVSFRVLRLRADTTIAEPPFWISPPRGSLVYRGADLDPALADTVALQRRVLSPEGTAGAALPPLRPGVYLLEATLEPSGLRQARPLAVMPPGHPALPSVEGFTEALAYIAYPSEMEALRRPAPLAERRRRFDEFWGTLLGGRRLAEATLRRYYDRVEAANRLFSGHKPGWMTDRGMLYVVLGPPDVVERTPEGERWHYAYGRPDPERTYAFERVTEYGPFEAYVLERAPRYEVEWQRAVRRWRSGEAR
jgi:GWxTD domain-containing protein